MKRKLLVSFLTLLVATSMVSAFNATPLVELVEGMFTIFAAFLTGVVGIMDEIFEVGVYVIAFVVMFIGVTLVFMMMDLNTWVSAIKKLTKR